MFEIGKIYHRRTDLHSKYGGNPQSGIAPCANYPIVFLFTSPRGEEHGYKDGWISDTVFQYTGEGQYGDMELTRGNLAIQRHKEQGRELHLFQRYGHGLYTYVGEFEYLKHEIRSGDDTDKNRRKMIVFYLKKCN